MSKPTLGTGELLKELAEFKFPRATQRRLTRLLDLNNDGELSSEQRHELRALAELSEQIAILKGQAMLVLGRKNG